MIIDLLYASFLNINDVTYTHHLYLLNTCHINI